MANLSRKARRFLDSYATQHTSYDIAAEEARLFVVDAIKSLPIPVHAVTSRAKKVPSLRSKLRRKRYDNPAADVTDLIGLRVITYFANHIDRVAAELRANLDVSEKKCRDARKALSPDRFGYRSVHLIARLRVGPAASPAYQHLKRRWFEVQIRSILDHAWSEIEHEVVYKSGIEYPSDVKRRFMAVAGSLEVLEQAFFSLAVERDSLIEKYKLDQLSNRDLDIRFDAARLMAFLEVQRPTGISWRSAESAGDPLPQGSAASAVEALESAGIQTPNKLLSTLGTARFRHNVAAFASMEGIAPSLTSHLAVVVLAVATVKPRVLSRQFPEMLFSPSISLIVTRSR